MKSVVFSHEERLFQNTRAIARIDMDEGISIERMETPRLILRPLEMTDAGALTALLQDPEIARWTLRLPWPYTIDDARSFISRQSAGDSAPEAVNWAIVEKATGALTGMIGLHDVEWQSRRAEIGYWMGESFRGKGYTTEAARRVVSWAFETGKLERIQATHFPGNEASAGVMRKIGMAPEGVMRGHAYKNGQFHDSHLYAVLRSDSTWMTTMEQGGGDA